MGRRALPRVPDCDLSNHLLELKQMVPPLSFDDLFPSATEFEVEVGSGKGLFLANSAKVHRERAFLGIEVARKYARFVAFRLGKERLENAKIIHGDAELFFHDFCPPQQLAAVHIYFPDPWWKKRHHKRRIMNPTFLQHVTRGLKTDGRLHFWTDVEQYFTQSVKIIQSSTHLVGPMDVVAPDPSHDFDFRTHFERRKRQEGLPIFRAEFVNPSVQDRTISDCS